jgi:transcriptional regulator with GAF, ATPase, and Fis domain
MEIAINGDQVAPTEIQSPRTVATSPRNENKTLPMQLVERPARDRIDRVLQLAEALLTEAEAFAYRSFNAGEPHLTTIDLREGIDFFKEVERFETILIRMALDESGGSQVRAARMLGLKTSTLNSIIKRLKIGR